MPENHGVPLSAVVVLAVGEVPAITGGRNWGQLVRRCIGFASVHLFRYLIDVWGFLPLRAAAGHGSDELALPLQWELVDGIGALRGARLWRVPWCVL